MAYSTHVAALRDVSGIPFRLLVIFAILLRRLIEL
jgi:hypothetical protein